MRRPLSLSSISLAALLCAGCATSKQAGRETTRYVAPLSVGLSGETFHALTISLDRAVQEGAVQGAVLAVGRDGQVIYEHAAGPGVTRGTLFDVASLTKPLATAAAAGLLACDGRLSPTGPVPPAVATLNELLLHSSGLPEYVTPETLAQEAGAKDKPGSAAVTLAKAAGAITARGDLRYSNLGYLLLSEHIEATTGQPLGEYLQAELWRPLGMNATTFRPLADSQAAPAATDVAPGRAFDPLADWILREAPGHDPGHSALFTTAADATLFAQALLAPEATATRTGMDVERLRCLSHFLLSNEVLFRTVRDAQGEAAHVPTKRTRGFAVEWENVEPELTGEPRYQTGYTGCLLWLHRESGLSIALLTTGAAGKPEKLEAIKRRIVLELARGDMR